MNNKQKILILALIFLMGHCEEISYYGNWGEWRNIKEAPRGFYLCGAQMKFQENQNKADNTAGNGLKFFFCNGGNWTNQYTIIEDGYWGDWKNVAMCPNGSFVNGMNIRFQKDQGKGDNTALNGLKLNCQGNDQVSSVIVVHEGIWGDWLGWQWINKLNRIHSVRVRIQSRIKGDESALNGICLYFTTMKIIGIDFQYRNPKQQNVPPSRLDFGNVQNVASTYSNVTGNITKQVAQKRMWENNDRFNAGGQISVGMQVKVPMVGKVSTQITASVQYTSSFTFGKQSTKAHKFTQNIVIPCRPCFNCSFQSQLNEAKVTIDYTANIRYEGGISVVHKGTFYGVMMSNSHDQVAQKPIENCTISEQI